ncbi:MAG: hypothetical protein AAF823_06460 [Planctomycetota bacterium]
MIDDDVLAMEPPKGWRVECGKAHYTFFATKQRFASFSLMTESWLTADDQYSHLRLSLVPPETSTSEWTFSVEDPFSVAGSKGFRVSAASRDQRMSHEKAAFLVGDVVLVAEAFNLKPYESDAWWSALSTVAIKATAAEAIERRFNLPQVGEQSLDATDLARPKCKRLTTWMDHSMVMLRDSEAAEEDNDLTAIEGDRLIEGERPSALWVTSLTEFDVTLLFCVRKDRPRTRVKRRREAERTISIPSGKLNVEMMTGGVLLEIEVNPGAYELLVRDDVPADAAAQDTGVETIEMTLWPLA